LVRRFAFFAILISCLSSGLSTTHTLYMTFARKANRLALKLAVPLAGDKRNVTALMSRYKNALLARW
jgi:hypothetical protein